MYSHQEIKEKIDANNRAMENLITPFKFTLNNKIAALMKENDELRAMCEHEYKNNECIWCYSRQK